MKVHYGRNLHIGDPVSIALFKKIHRKLTSDNEVIRVYLEKPIVLPHLPHLPPGSKLPARTASVLKKCPDIARAIARCPDLIDRLNRYPCLRYPLTSALDEIARRYCFTIEKIRKIYADKLRQGEALKIPDCERFWCDAYREEQYNKIFLAHSEMSDLLANDQYDVIAGSDFKKRWPPVTSYDRCYYALADGGFGMLVLSGPPPTFEGVESESTSAIKGSEIHLSNGILEIKWKLPETPFRQAETQTLFRGEIHLDLSRNLQAYLDGIAIGFLPEPPDPSPEAPEPLSNALPGHFHGRERREILYCHTKVALNFPFWIDVSSNKLVWTPPEWQHIKNHRGSWIMAIVQLLSPVSPNQSAKVLQHALRKLASRMWTQEFVNERKRAPAPPSPLNHLPEWSDVGQQADRPTNEAQ